MQCNKGFAANLLLSLSPTAKEFSKSVNICQSYAYDLSDMFFLTHSVVVSVVAVCW